MTFVTFVFFLLSKQVMCQAPKFKKFSLTFLDVSHKNVIEIRDLSIYSYLKINFQLSIIELKLTAASISSYRQKCDLLNQLKSNLKS